MLFTLTPLMADPVQPSYPLWSKIPLQPCPPYPALNSQKQVFEPPACQDYCTHVAKQTDIYHNTFIIKKSTPIKVLYDPII